MNIEIENLILDFADGVNLRFFSAGEKLPLKHQLFIGFEDGSALVGTISMYGCMLCDKAENLEENIYYLSAKEKISPLSDEFDYKYYESLLNEKALKLSAKGFIATEQRIPGLGNGTAQDILLNAKIHPKKKMNTLTEEQKKILFESIKNTLKEMTDCGGRDTEKDLFGTPGKYKTKLCKKTAFCQNCGGPVVKDNFLGGSIYFCLDCQEK